MKGLPRVSLNPRKLYDESVHHLLLTSEWGTKLNPRTLSNGLTAYMNGMTDGDAILSVMFTAAAAPNEGVVN